MMKNTLERLAALWKWFTDQAKKRRNGLSGSKVPATVNRSEVTTNIKWNHISGQWTRFQGKARERWSDLTDNELMEVNGRYEILAKIIQEKYSVDRAEAKQQIDLWTASLKV